jgi:N12 class adenine-specific DNA methylase
VSQYEDYLDQPDRVDPYGAYLDLGAPPRKATKAGAGVVRTLADQALSLGQGVVGGVKALVDIGGTGTAASRGLGTLNQGIEGLYSPTRTAEKQARQATIEEADTSGGTLDQVTSRLGGFAEAPAQTLLQGIGSMAPTVAAAVLSKGRTLAALPVGAAMGVGGIKGQNYDAVKAEATKQGLGEAQAEQLASRASEYNLSNAPQQALGGALGALDAGFGVERLLSNIVRGTVSPASRLKRVGIGAIEEAIPEGLQGSQGRYAQNLALTEAGFPTDLMSGVVGSGVHDAAVGAALGAGAGLPGRRALAAQQSPESIPQPIPSPGDPIRAGSLPAAGPLTNAVNIGIEGEAQAADVGVPTEAPIAAGLAGVPSTDAPHPDTKKPRGGKAAPGPLEAVAPEGGTEKPTFDPTTGEITPPQRASWPTREAVDQYLTQQRVSGGAKTGKAAPVELKGGGFSFLREGEPGYEEAAAAKPLPKLAQGKPKSAKQTKLQERRAKAEEKKAAKAAKASSVPIQPETAPETPTTPAPTVDEAAHVAATSTQNELPQPTQAQKEAGNYQKGHVAVGGLDISIENPQGSTRSGTDRSGKAWTVKMAHHYGYILGTVGADKDHIDTFIKPGTAEDYAGPAFVVDQVHPETGKFDEHKIMLGFPSALEARRAYAKNYAKGWKGLKSITPASLDELKAWLAGGHTKTAFSTRPTPIEQQVTAHGAPGTPIGVKTEGVPTAPTVPAPTQKAPAGLPAGSMAAPADDVVRNLRKLSHDTEAPGDVMLGNDKFVSMDEAIAAARAAMTPREHGMPFQFMRVLDISGRDLKRIVAAMKEGAPNAEAVRSDEEQVRPGGTEGQPSVQPGPEQGGGDLQQPPPEAAGDRGVGAEGPKEEVAPKTLRERRRAAVAEAAQKRADQEAAAGGNPHVWSGRAARKAGHSRTPPPEITGRRHIKMWLEGWDAAGPAEAPVAKAEDTQGAGATGEKTLADLVKAIDKKLPKPEKKQTDLQRRRAESKAKKGQGAAETGRILGENSDGNNVLEDPSGVRSYVTKEGVRVEETVALTPTRQGIVTSPVKPRAAEFKTAEEISAELAPPTTTPTKEAPDDSATPIPAPPVDQPMVERAAGNGEAPFRGAILESGIPGPADDGGLRGGGGPIEGLNDAGGNLGNGRGDGLLPNGPPDNLGDRQKRVSPDLDYRPGIGDLTRTGSWFETAGRNVDIIELAIKIDAEKRAATPEEQAQLAKYVGFGAGEIANALFPVPSEWARKQEPARLIWPDLVAQREKRWGPLAERLAALPVEWQKSILQSTQYAHYTSENMVRSIWAAVGRLGFTGGKMFEPGGGIGTFPMLMPESIRKDSKYTAIEFDGPTALISRLLTPGQNMLHDDFIKRKVPRNYFDLGIGNPPFSQTPILGDPDYAKFGFMLHDFFFAKTIDRVRPGGLQVFVTSKGTMDKQNAKARKYLAARADLLGAIRLPSTAFQGNAGTSVVTDVLFLRKRAEGEAPAGEAWQDLKSVDTPDGPVLINEYFAKNPHMVLGQNRISGNTDDKGRRINSNGRGGEKYTVVSYDETPAQLDAKFAKAVESLPQNVYSTMTASAETLRQQTAKIEFDPKIKREGVIYVAADGTLMRVENGAGRSLATMVRLSAKDTAWLKGYVGIRDAVQLARAAQVADGDWQAALKTLNKVYDKFLKDHGPINAFRIQVYKRTDEEGNETEVPRRVLTNRRLFREDYDQALVTQIEQITDDDKIIKAKFLRERTIGKPLVREVKTVGDALAVSLDELGRFDPKDVAKRINLTQEEALDALGAGVYKTPQGEWQLADEYLSGDVVAKLAEAQHAARDDASLERNVAALKEAQPEKLGPSQISPKLGASWVAAEFVSEFAKEIEAGHVTFDVKTESWQVTGSDKRSERRAGADYGSADRSSSELLEAMLNSRDIVVKYGRSAGEDLAGKVNPTATTAANEAASKIREKFRSWVWTDSERAVTLVETYNERFNNLAGRKFDGSHMTLPGLRQGFVPHAHQLRAIWRQIQTGNTYLAHAVGAGKTFEMIAGGMEQRRLGLISKPMYVVPNHMLEQFSNEFLEFYPLANIMVADDENFHTDRRRAFIAAATLNAPDAIIITHSAFERIGVKAESVDPIRDQVIGDLQAELDDSDSSDRVRRKNLEQQIEAVNQRFDRILAAGGKDSTIKFEDMGVDFVYVDEAHDYRKLDFATNQSVKGVDPKGSRRAMDMYVKTRYLEKKSPGRSMVFATGTPVTNTMGELYTIMKFFAPETLSRDDISTFDAWARMFGEVVTDLESNVAGRYEPVTRFAKFDNVVELMTRVRQFMDVLTSDSLGALVKRPDVAGGGPHMIVVEPTSQLRDYMRTVLAPRVETSRKWKPSPDQPNNPDPMLNIITDGRFAGLDPRFFGAKLDPGTVTPLTKLGETIIDEYKASADNPYADAAGKVEALKGGTQIVFYNLGFGAQSMANRGFNARLALNKQLTAGGVKREHIAWFDEAKTDAAKEALFKAMRAGQIRVLIGSAKKMGTGVNVQKRLTALQYLDPPWFPADVEQPHGRILRQGNQNDVVRINWFAAKGSYAEAMWQMVARKQRFIDQAFRGDKTMRSMEDMDEASQYAQASALSSDDPRAMQLAGLRQDVTRYENLQRAHASEQIAVKDAIRQATYKAENHAKRLAVFEKAFKAIGGEHIYFESGNVNGKEYAKSKEFGQALKDRFNQLIADAVLSPYQEKRPLGSIGSVELWIRHLTFYDTGLKAQVPGSTFQLMATVGGLDLDVMTTEGMGSDIDDQGLTRRVLNSANSLSGSVDHERDGLKEQQTELTRLKKKFGAPFEHAHQMAEKYGDLKRLEAELEAEGKAKPAAPAAAVEPEGSTNLRQTGAPEANTTDTVQFSVVSARAFSKPKPIGADSGVNFNREKAVANLPASVRDDPFFGPEKTAMRNVHARTALWDKLQAFGKEQGLPPYTLGVDSIGNITVGKPAPQIALKLLAEFADANDTGVYVLAQSAQQSVEKISAYRPIGYEPTTGLGLYGQSRGSGGTSDGLGFATFAYKPRGISEFMFAVGDAPVSERGPTAQNIANAPASLADRNATAKLQASINTVWPDFVLDPISARAAGKGRDALSELIKRVFTTRRVVWFQANHLFADGVHDQKQRDVIFLNVRSQRPHLAAAGHEMLHALSLEQPALYAQLRTRILALGKDLDLRHARLQGTRIKVLGEDGRMTLAGLEEEFIADVVGDNFMDPKFWQMLAKDQPSGFQAVLKAILNWIDDVLSKIRAQTPFGTNEFLTDMVAARKAVAETIRAFAPAIDEGLSGADINLSVAAQAPPFYSALARQVEKSAMKQGDAAAWKQAIKGMVNSGVVKADEVQWTGMDEWLDLQQGKITRQAVGDFLNANGVQVTETVLGDGAPTPLKWGKESAEDENDESFMESADGYRIVRAADGALSIYTPDGDQIHGDIFGDERAKELAAADAAGDDGATVTKYGQYQLPGGPLSRDTEILSREGWLRMDEVQVGDIVMTRRDDDGALEWQEVEAVPTVFADKLYHFKNQSIDMRVTACHNMLVKRRRRSSGGLFRAKAADLWTMAECVAPLVGEWADGAAAPLYGYAAQDAAELIGWYIAEGSAVTEDGKKSTLAISQSREANPAKCDQIEALLGRMGVAWNYVESGPAYYLSIKSMDRGLVALLHAQGKSHDKYIPGFMFEQPRSVIVALMDGLLLGDGNLACKDSPTREPRWAYHTMSKQLADDMQALALLSGVRGTISQRPTGLYEVRLNSKQWASIDDAKHAIVDYNDTAYCVTVQNHAIYVRTGGVAAFTGNSNYREVLLTLPRGVVNKLDDAEIAAEGTNPTSGKPYVRFNWHGQTYVVEREAGESSRDAMLRRINSDREGRGAGEVRPQSEFRSNHWDQPNVLAHIRLNDRTDADGKRVLFVEEIQSDWGQAGKKKGFATGGSPARDAFKAFEADVRKRFREQVIGEATELKPERREAWADTIVNNSTIGDMARAVGEGERARELQRAEMEEESAAGKTVPAAPFVGKTDAWVSLAIKRVIKIAVDGGYDRVAFVNGDQSALRYKEALMKAVDTIAIKRNDGGTYTLDAFKDGAAVHEETHIGAEKVRELLGKAGDDIIAKADSGVGADAGGYVTIKTGDMDIGGAGMRAFYDKIVPNVAKEVLRKVGGGQMKTVDLSSPALAETRRRMGVATVDAKQQPGFDITPAMREKAAGGLPMFSVASNIEAGLNRARDINLPLRYKLGDLFNDNGRLNWWHKTVGTMHNLAQRSPAFRRVYDTTQNFLNDVSYYATEASSLAPTILPKLETWKDIGRTPLSAADTKALAGPVFEGTLMWTRDANGTPVPQPDVQKAGIVWTDAELRSRFQMTPKQIDLYRQFRATIDKSLENLAISDMLRYGGADVAKVRQQALDAGSVDAAAMVLHDHLVESAAEDEDRAPLLLSTAKAIMDKAERANDLMARGYAPLSRFGQYTLDVVDGAGERVYFGLFETARERSRKAREMRADNPRARITQGTVSEEAYRLFAGVTPETLELFGGMLGLESQGSNAASQAFQEYLKIARSNRSALKRLIERKGVAGFSEDAGRVLAGFVYSNARQTSSNLHMGELTESIEAIPQGAGQLKDRAVALAEYVKNPTEEAQGLRGLLFAQFLGGSVAAAMVNMLQPVQVTLPYLSQFGGIAKAARQMLAAVKDANKRLTGDAALDAALHKAAEEGIVSPQEVHQLMAQAMGRGAQRSGDGTLMGNLSARGMNYTAKLLFGWGKVFGVAEQFNRRVTFIAAYRTAAEQGRSDPAGFASRAVAETQFTYNKGNKPAWARGAVGSTLFTFKQYSISYLELLHRMWTQGGADGKRATLLALGILFLMSGAGGLPGSDDLDDLIDGFMQSVMGLNFSSKRAKREFFAETLGLGADGSRFLEHGLSGLPGSPIDVSGRLGLGNLIPGTGLLTRKADHTADVAEIAGPAGDVIKRTFQAGGKLLTGDVKEALGLISPIAVQNLIKANDMATTGMYRDKSGKKILDVDGYDAAMKAIGFQPVDVARVQEASRTAAQMIGLNRMRETEIADRWARAIFEKKPEDIAAARDSLRDWNVDNPQSPIRIVPNQIKTRVEAMTVDRATRLQKTAPKEIRAQVHRELQLNQR